MILRSVGIAGAVVVGLAVAAALTLLPAILGVLGPRIDALAIRQVTVTPGSEGPWARLARAVMRRPVAVLVPTLAAAPAPRPAVPRASASTPRTRRSCRRPCRHARPTSCSPASSARASSPHSRWRSGRRRPPRTREPRRALRLLAPARRGPAGHPCRRPRRRRPAADPRPVPAPLRAPVRTAGPVRRRRPSRPRPPATSPRSTSTRPTARTPTQGRALVQDLRASSGPLAPPAGITVLVSGGAAEVAGRRERDGRRVPADRPCSSS